MKFKGDSKRKRGRPSKGESRREKLENFVGLLESHESGPLSPELIKMARSLHGLPDPEKDERPSLGEKQWRALEKDKFRPIVELRKISADIVAEHAGVSRQTISAWRKDENYIRGQQWLFATKLAKRINENSPEENSASRWSRYSREKKLLLIRIYLSENAKPGAIQTPLREEPFRDLDEYAAYLLDHDMVPRDVFVKQK